MQGFGRGQSQSRACPATTRPAASRGGGISAAQASDRAAAAGGRLRPRSSHRRVLPQTAFSGTRGGATRACWADPGRTEAFYTRGRDTDQAGRAVALGSHRAASRSCTSHASQADFLQTDSSPRRQKPSEGRALSFLPPRTPPFCPCPLVGAEKATSPLHPRPPFFSPLRGLPCVKKSHKGHNMSLSSAFPSGSGPIFLAKTSASSKHRDQCT